MKRYEVEQFWDNEYYQNHWEEYDVWIDEISKVTGLSDFDITNVAHMLSHDWLAFCENPKGYEGTIVIECIKQYISELKPYQVQYGIDAGGPESGPIFHTGYCWLLAHDTDEDEKWFLASNVEDLEGWSIDEMTWEEYRKIEKEHNMSMDELLA
jgi:hypothetical protein